jgi:transposase InsO family protein
VRNPEWRGRKRVHGVIPDVGTIKYEDIYIKNYEQVPELETGLRAYFWFYDEERPHQSLDYRTPGEVHRARIHGG